MKKQNLVVIGNGMVGQKLLDQLAESGATARYAITVLCEEPRPAYDRVQLTAYFSGSSAADLALVEQTFFDTHGIALQLNCRSVAIDRDKRQVHSAAGACFDYDKLVLATGSYPFVPPIPGHDRDGCYVYRTIEDLDAIRQGRQWPQQRRGGRRRPARPRSAKALKDLGLKTHVVEFAPRLMAVQVDEGGGRILRGKIEALGVMVHTEKNTQEIVDGSGMRHRMRFVDGSELESDLIVFSAGIRPRDELARQAGLEVGPRGGVVINDCARPPTPISTPSARCALWDGRIFGLVAPGYQMARVAASHLQGSEVVAFTGADMSTKLKLMGVDVAQHRRCPRPHPGCAQLHLHRRSQGDLQTHRRQR
jgi:nitrite reductase (NADH) large subunit